MVTKSTRSLCRAIVASLLVAIAGSALAQQKAAEVEAKIGKVIGKVSEVWVKNIRYEGFHKDLAAKFPDTPAWPTFTAEEQWITVISSKSVMFPGVFKGRSKTAMGLQLGDIVEMTLAKAEPKSYDDLGQVTRLVCRKADPEFAKCAQQNPLTWFDRSGAQMQQLQ